MKLWTKIVVGIGAVMFFTFVLPVLVTSGVNWLFGIATAILSVAAVLLWGSTIGEDKQKVQKTESVDGTLAHQEETTN